MPKSPTSMRALEADRPERAHQERADRQLAAEEAGAEREGAEEIAEVNQERDAEVGIAEPEDERGGRSAGRRS